MMTMIMINFCRENFEENFRIKNLYIKKIKNNNHMKRKREKMSML